MLGGALNRMLHRQLSMAWEKWQMWYAIRVAQRRLLDEAMRRFVHRKMFAQAISDQKDENFGDYTTGHGFFECARAYESFDMRPAADSIWYSVQEAVKSLTVTKAKGKTRSESSSSSGSDSSDSDSDSNSSNSSKLNGKVVPSSLQFSPCDPIELDFGDHHEDVFDEALDEELFEELFGDEAGSTGCESAQPMPKRRRAIDSDDE